MADLDQFVVGKCNRVSHNKSKNFVVMLRKVYFVKPRPELSYF
jgi:hypothetical protein